MRTQEEIEIELVELNYELEKLQEDIFNGYSNSITEVKQIKLKINSLEWVLKQLKL